MYTTKNLSSLYKSASHKRLPNPQRVGEGGNFFYFYGSFWTEQLKTNVKYNRMFCAPKQIDMQHLKNIYVYKQETKRVNREFLGQLTYRTTTKFEENKIEC